MKHTDNPPVTPASVMLDTRPYLERQLVVVPDGTVITNNEPPRQRHVVTNDAGCRVGDNLYVTERGAQQIISAMRAAGAPVLFQR